MRTTAETTSHHRSPTRSKRGHSDRDVRSLLRGVKSARECVKHSYEFLRDGKPDEALAVLSEGHSRFTSKNDERLLTTVLMQIRASSICHILRSGVNPYKARAAL